MKILESRDEINEMRQLDVLNWSEHDNSKQTKVNKKLLDENSEDNNLEDPIIPLSLHANFDIINEKNWIINDLYNDTFGINSLERNKPKLKKIAFYNRNKAKTIKIYSSQNNNRKLNIKATGQIGRAHV